MAQASLPSPLKAAPIPVLGFQSLRRGETGALPREVAIKLAEGKDNIIHKTSTDFKEKVKFTPANCARIQTLKKCKVLKSQSPILST